MSVSAVICRSKREGKREKEREREREREKEREKERERERERERYTCRHSYADNRGTDSEQAAHRDETGKGITYGISQFFFDNSPLDGIKPSSQSIKQQQAKREERACLRVTQRAGLSERVWKARMEMETLEAKRTRKKQTTFFSFFFFFLHLRVFGLKRKVRVRARKFAAPVCNHLDENPRMVPPDHRCPAFARFPRTHGRLTNSTTAYF